MTQDQLELLNQIIGHDKWAVRMLPDGKSAVVEGHVEIAVADKKHAADLIVSIRNMFMEQVEELAKLKAKASIRGGTFGVAIEAAVDDAVKEAVAETLGKDK